MVGNFQKNIEILSESDILSTLTTLGAILKINGKKVKVIRLDFDDKEQHQKGTNFRFEPEMGATLDDEEKDFLNEFVNKMKW